MSCESEVQTIGIQMELKYCERCGGLWLRMKDEKGVHCGLCRAHFAALPKRGGGSYRKARRRKVRNSEEMIGVEIDYLAGVEEREERI